GQIQYLTKRGVGLNNATQGGLITASGANNALRGIQFVGPQGTPVPFNFGITSGILSWGGDARPSTYEGEQNAMSFPERAVNVYLNATYDIFDNLKATIEAEYGRVKGQNAGYSYISQDTIKIDNAYLDPSIVARMTALGLTTFTLGTTNTNN